MPKRSRNARALHRQDAGLSGAREAALLVTGMERPGGRTWSWPAAAALIAACVVFAACLRLCWTGYSESDDQFYAAAAEGWRQHAPYLGLNHWGIRHVIVLPMALLFALFGQSETTLVLPAVLYATGLIALLGYIAFRLHGWLACACAIALAGSLPVVATGASLVSTDVPEAFYVIGSVWGYICAAQRGSTRLFLLSGLLAGLAVITRETAVALLALYALLFVARRGRRWRWVLRPASWPVSALWWRWQPPRRGCPYRPVHRTRSLLAAGRARTGHTGQQRTAGAGCVVFLQQPAAAPAAARMAVRATASLMAAAELHAGGAQVDGRVCHHAGAGNVSARGSGRQTRSAAACGGHLPGAGALTAAVPSNT